MKHLMLDIETMGTESFSSIVSIGALEFDIEKIKQVFEKNGIKYDVGF